MVHLVCDRLKPALHTLDASNHRRELVTDNGLRAERLSKGLPLVHPPTYKKVKKKVCPRSAHFLPWIR